MSSPKGCPTLHKLLIQLIQQCELFSSTLMQDMSTFIKAKPTVTFPLSPNPDVHATHIVVDEVEVVSWCDSHGVSALLCQPRVGLVEGLVYIHKGIDDGLSVCWRLGELRVHNRDDIWWNKLQ